jgi:hypothetical protein
VRLPLNEIDHPSSPPAGTWYPVTPMPLNDQPPPLPCQYDQYFWVGFVTTPLMPITNPPA